MEMERGNEFTLGSLSSVGSVMLGGKDLVIESSGPLESFRGRFSDGKWARHFIDKPWSWSNPSTSSFIAISCRPCGFTRGRSSRNDYLLPILTAPNDPRSRFTFFQINPIDILLILNSLLLDYDESYL